MTGVVRSWRRGEYCLAIIRLVFYTADTLTVRLLLAFASGAYALLLVWPEISNAVRQGLLHMAPVLECCVSGMQDPSVFNRPAYAIMALVPGGVWTWAALFMAHMIGVHWRVFDPVRRDGWALAINALGLVVWAYSTASLIIALRMVLPSSALELVILFFSFWVMVRTGLAEEIVSA